MKCVAKAKSPVKLKSDSSAILVIFFLRTQMRYVTRIRIPCLYIFMWIEYSWVQSQTQRKVYAGILLLGKIRGQRKRGRQRMRWSDSITDSVDMNLSKLWETVNDRGTWHTALYEVAKSRTWLSDWTTWVKWENWYKISHLNVKVTYMKTESSGEYALLWILLHL